MTTPQVAHTPVFIDPDAFVLDGHELRAGIELGTTSRFGDGIWDLHPINHQDQLVRSILNFPTLPEPFRAVAKELFYALLVGETATRGGPPQTGVYSYCLQPREEVLGLGTHAGPLHTGGDDPRGPRRLSTMGPAHGFEPNAARYAQAGRPAVLGVPRCPPH